MPGPSSETESSHCASEVPQPDEDPPAAGGELDRVRQEVPHDLLQAVRVPRDGRRARVEILFEAHLPGVRRGPDGVERAVHDVDEADRPHREAQLPGHDPGHVEDVGDELVLDLGVPVDRLDGPPRRLGIQLSRPEHVRPSHDRVERSPELVRERCEELVLEPVRLLRLEVEPRVLDGDARPVRDLLAERDLRGFPRAIRPAPHERALALSEDRDGHDEEVPVPQDVEEPRMLRVDPGRSQAFGRDDDRPPCPDRFDAGVLGVGPESLVAEPGRVAGAAWIPVCGDRAPEASVRIDDVEDAPVGDRRERRARRRGERLLVVEGRRQGGGHAREDRRSPLRGLAGEDLVPARVGGPRLDGPSPRGRGSPPRPGAR